MKSILPCLALLLPLHADTRHVDQSVAASGDGTSWATAFKTLQEALAASSSPDVIRIAAGSYYPDEGGFYTDNDAIATFQLVSGVTLEGGYPTGGGTRDLTAHATILSGDLEQNDSGAPTGENSQSVVHGFNVNSDTVLDGLTIRGGLADGVEPQPFDGPTRSGGGIYLIGSSPTIRNCIFEGNFAGFGGGAFCIDFSSPTFVNCVFSGNDASFFGGGLNVRTSNPVLVNCTFSGNSASSFSGGGAIANYSSTPVLTNCIIWNNREFGRTTSPEASLNYAAGANYTINHSLIHNTAATGTNLDGTSDLNNPLFVTPVDPAAAPVSGGNFRLSSGTPAIHAGDNAANTETTDLAGNPRAAGPAIDLGAFEGGVAPTDTDNDGLADSFELAFTHPPSTTALDPASNTDGDPFTALEEFAFGLSPERADPVAAAYQMTITPDGGDDYLSITATRRPTSQPFVNMVPQQSLDLGQSDPWSAAALVPLGLPAPMIGARSTLPFGSEDSEFLRIRVFRP